jgi:ABC-type Zn2+ transport system substrate-binding protein/surface adhesin
MEIPMRRLLLALPLALLPLSLAQAHQHGHKHDHKHEHSHEHAEHGSLGAHEHGTAELNVVLDGQTLEIELKSPAMNLLGFEHAAKSDADKAKVAGVRSQLEAPQALFGLSAGNCTLSEQALESPLFADAKAHKEHDHKHDKKHAHKHDHKHKHAEHKADEHGHDEHSDIHAHYRFTCQQPQDLKQLDLAELFTRFPGTEKIQVQLIGPNGQQGLELGQGKTTLSF